MDLTSAIGSSMVGDMPKTSDEMIEELEALPAYEERFVIIRVQGYEQIYKLMARDLPGRGRRFTNLDTGSELWFRGGGSRPAAYAHDIECLGYGTHALVNQVVN